MNIFSDLPEKESVFVSYGVPKKILLYLNTPAKIATQ
jgi:hypothetical protein